MSRRPQLMHGFVRLVSPLLLVLVLVVATPTPCAHSQEATGLDGVRATYHGLLDLFYRPLEPRDLLQAGWSSLRSNAERHGAAVPNTLPDLPPGADDAFDVFASSYAEYVASLPSSASATAAAADVEAGMAESAMERHTHYLPPAVWQRFLATIAGGQASTGVGVSLVSDPNGNEPAGLITNVAPDSPAAQAGLIPGDVIVAADGKDLAPGDRDGLRAALAGADGTPVALSIDRGDGSLRSVVVTRGRYYFPPLESRVLPGGIGYLRLTDFAIAGTTLPNGSELVSEFDRRLDELDAQGVTGLLLDLRGNGGGSVQTADEIVGRFLSEDTRTIHEYDQRGHESYDVASGLVRARQLPMVVLIDDGSASAAEITAGVLHQAKRAVLVGQRSAGVVASSLPVPVPGGGGLQVAVAAASVAGLSTALDGVGITPDVTASGARTLADYRTGHDAQIDAAVAALATAPPPPSLSVPAPPTTSAELDRLLEGVLPSPAELPTNDRLTQTNRWQRMDFVHPNQLVDQNGGSPDPIELQQLMRARGYQGTVLASYGSEVGNLPAVIVNADLYATADGAHTAVSTNDLTVLLKPIDPLVDVGEESVSYRGAWLANGSTLVAWRRGRLVVTVTYSDVPGIERPDTVAQIARVVDARTQQLAVLP